MSVGFVEGPNGRNGGLERIGRGEHENRAETRSKRGTERGPIWPVTSCILYALHTRAQGSYKFKSGGGGSEWRKENGKAAVTKE